MRIAFICSDAVMITFFFFFFTPVRFCREVPELPRIRKVMHTPGHPEGHGEEEKGSMLTLNGWNLPWPKKQTKTKNHEPLCSNFVWSYCDLKKKQISKHWLWIDHLQFKTNKKTFDCDLIDWVLKQTTLIGNWLIVTWNKNKHLIMIWKERNRQTNFWLCG